MLHNISVVSNWTAIGIIAALQIYAFVHGFGWRTLPINLPLIAINVLYLVL